jgi:hypothetical protein
MAGAITLADEWYQLQPFGLPIGWDLVRLRGTRSWPAEETILIKMVGLFLSACEIIVGAPIWFDVLNRFVNIRSGGKPPEDMPPRPREVSTTQNAV